MAKPNNQWQEQAREAAERIDRNRELGEQLSFLPDPVEPEVPARADQGKAVGRPAGAKNKGSSQLRLWLAEQGYTLPEEQIAQIAGLAGSDDVVTEMIARAERVLAWSFDGAHVGDRDAPRATPAMRLELFRFLYATARQAAEALLPFGTPKAAPEVEVNQQVTMIVPSAPAQPGDQARVIHATRTHRMAPPPLPAEIVENQGVSEADQNGSDE